MKNKENTKKIENKRDMDFMNEEEIVSAGEKYQAIFEYLLSDEKLQNILVNYLHFLRTK